MANNNVFRISSAVSSIGIFGKIKKIPDLLGFSRHSACERRISVALQNGVWANVVSLVLSGGGILASATAATPMQLVIGYASLMSGALLFAWGIRINNRHIWQRWWHSIENVRHGIVPICLDDALRYLANDSAWAKTLDKNDQNFAIRVSGALTSALASGDIDARGRYFHVLKGGVKDPPLHPRIKVPADFWEKTNINAWWALNNSPQFLGGRMEPNGLPPYDNGYEGLHDVWLDSRRLRQIWPPAKS